MTNEPLVPTCECGTIISSYGGRCPTCGTLWPEAPRRSAPPSQGSAENPHRGSQSSTTDTVRASSAPGQLRAASIPATASDGARRRSKTPVVAGLVAGLLIAGATVYWMNQKDAVAPEAEHAAAAVAVTVPRETTGTPDPGVLALSDLAEIAPLNVLPKARRRAETWNANAVLISIRAKGVTRGLLDAVRGGSLRLEFGIPRDKGALGTGKPVGGKRLVVSVDQDGSRVTERSAGGRAVSVGDPDCPLPSAWHKMSKSGVPKTETVSFTYAARRGDQRAVWTAKVSGKPELTRTLDGRECTILTN